MYENGQVSEPTFWPVNFRRYRELWMERDTGFTKSYCFQLNSLSLAVKNGGSQGWEMVWWVKCLLCKHRDLIQIPSTNVKPDAGHMCVIPMLGVRVGGRQVDP